MKEHIPNEQHIADILQSGGIGIMPTDTLYGIVSSAANAGAVERIYHLRKRESHKPLIVLIADIADLGAFSVRLSDRQKAVLEKIWPAPVSVVLECPEARLRYLHRGGGTIAFRLPRPKWLRDFLKKTGPLVAPSANTSGKKPAETINEARAYFGDEVDFSVDFGSLQSEPSTLVTVKPDGIVTVLRQGKIIIH